MKYCKHYSVLKSNILVCKLLLKLLNCAFNLIKSTKPCEASTMLFVCFMGCKSRNTRCENWSHLLIPMD